mgnify:CR=1 FL=1
MTGARQVLLVNRNPRNLDLLDRVLDEAGYATSKVADLDAFDRALAQPERLSLALVDITGFDAAIWARCERLREHGIPLLLVAPRQNAAVAEAGERHGARSVLVSLWQVDDRATALLMERFYANLRERGLGKAAALQEAQIWLQRYEVAGRRPFAAPRYWGAFVLVGEG